MLASLRNRQLNPRTRIIRLVVALVICGVAYHYVYRAGRDSPTRHAVQPSDASPGTVTRVLDGDSFEIAGDGGMITVRLFGVDCPEKDQPFADEARRYTSDMILGKEMRVDPVETDRYGRTIADVYTGDGTHLNAKLVEVGLAWWYEHYAPDATALRDLEASARKAKRGLWSRIDPIPPWEYREQQRR